MDVQDNAVLVGSRPTLNFKGATISDDNINDRVDITIIPTPLTNNTPTSIEIGDTGNPGVSLEAARADHQHALTAPSAPSTAAGATNIAGISDNAARADHVHRIEVNVQSNGIAASSRPTLNFVNATVADDNVLDKATITIPIAPSPLNTNANSTVSLNGVETTLISGSITLPSDTTGRIFVSFTGMISVGTVTTGTNGAQIRLKVAGNIVTGSVRQYQYTATAGVTVAFDRIPIALNTWLFLY